MFVGWVPPPDKLEGNVSIFGENKTDEHYLKAKVLEFCPTKDLNFSLRNKNMASETDLKVQTRSLITSQFARS